MHLCEIFRQFARARHNTFCWHHRKRGVAINLLILSSICSLRHILVILCLWALHLDELKFFFFARVRYRTRCSCAKAYYNRRDARSADPLLLSRSSTTASTCRHYIYLCVARRNGLISLSMLWV